MIRSISVALPILVFCSASAQRDDHHSPFMIESGSKTNFPIPITSIKQVPELISSQQTPPIFPASPPDRFDLGRESAKNELNTYRIQKLEDQVQSIRSSLDWIKGAWWALGGFAIALGTVLRFFGLTILAAIANRVRPKII